MYGKLFSQMYDGTLATKGPWQALVTFQQMIILADSAGIVDMTPESISRRTTIPLEIIRAGIDALEKPDSESRSPALEGRRITRLADDRTWGWQIVNHNHYRKIRSHEERREYMRTYQAARRAKEKAVNYSVNESKQSNPCSMQYAVSSKQETTLSGKPDVNPLTAKNQEEKAAAKRILEFLNEKTGRHYRAADVNIKMIAARLHEGATETQCRQVIAKKAREWSADERMSLYLRPATLFNNTKFNQYIGELVNHGD